jgi:hypothetical protein
MPTHRGSCHCGNLQFEIESEVERVFKCNCSFCVRRAATLHVVSPDRFRFVKGHAGDIDGANVYGAGVFLHHFCPNCGIHCFTIREANRRHDPGVVLNMGCFDSHLTDGLVPTSFDGASLPADSREWE